MALIAAIVVHDKRAIEERKGKGRKRLPLKEQAWVIGTLPACVARRLPAQREQVGSNHHSLSPSSLSKEGGEYLYSDSGIFD